jgi:hypothetical protein
VGALLRVMAPGAGATAVALALGHGVRHALHGLPPLLAAGCTLSAFAVAYLLLVKRLSAPVRDEAFQGHWGWLADGIAARLPGFQRKVAR